MSAAEDITTQARMVRIEDLDQSPTNPRRQQNPKADAELLDSVKKHGVLQPVLARPRPDGRLELVFGSRRLRAAQGAGRTEIPAMVRDMNDLEVLEAQLVENAQRADMDPLDEAEAYRQLHETHGKSVDEIAAKVGKSKGTVYARLTLCKLGKDGQKALRGGKIETSHALLIARVPATLQAEALKRMLDWQGEAISYRRAVELVQDDFMLRLDEAAFSRTDADLVPAAGACSACPKRTGNQRELFADVKNGDVCTDPVCFKGKTDAAWKVKAAAARAEGREVLEGKDADGISHTGRYVQLSEQCWEDPKRRTYQKLLGKDAPPAAIARTKRDEVLELVPKAAAFKVLRERGHAFAKRVPASEAKRHSNTPQTYEKRRAVNQEIRRRTAAALFGAARARAFDEGAMRFAAHWLARDGVLEDYEAFLLELAGPAPATKAKKKGRTFGEARERIGAWIDAAPIADVGALLMLVAAAQDYSGASAKAAAELLEVDLAGIKGEVTADLKRLAAAAKPAKKKPRKKVQACRECGCTNENCEQCIAKTGAPCTWVAPDLCSACEVPA